MDGLPKVNKYFFRLRICVFFLSCFHISTWTVFVKRLFRFRTPPTTWQGWTTHRAHRGMMEKWEETSSTHSKVKVWVDSDPNPETCHFPHLPIIYTTVQKFGVSQDKHFFYKSTFYKYYFFFFYFTFIQQIYLSKVTVKTWLHDTRY